MNSERVRGTVTAGGTTSGGNRNRRRRVAAAVAVLSLGGVLVVVAASSPGPRGGAGAWSLAGSALVGAVGMVARGEGGDAIEALTAKIDRFCAGEDVAFETEREDAVGDLYAAVDRLAGAARDGDSTGSVETGRADEGTAGAESESDRYRRRLYEVTSDPDLTDEEKVRAVLELGCERLGVECGLVTRIDPETGRYETETVEGTDFVDEGVVTDVSETFCRKTIDSDDLLGIYDAVAEGFGGDPGHAVWNVGCYLGGKLLVDDGLYGTLCFVAEEPRGEPFTDAEKAFVDLASRWVAHVLERRQRLEQLRLVERSVDAAPVGMAITDHADERVRLVRTNDAFEAVTGYTAEAARDRDRDWWSLLGGADGPVARLREAVTAGEAATVELRTERPDGEPVWQRVSVAPVAGGATDAGETSGADGAADADGAEAADGAKGADGGGATRFVWFHEDVTESTEASRRFEALVANTPSPVYVKDRDGVYRFVNEAAADLFGVEPADVVGKRDADVFDAETAAAIGEVDERVLEGETVVAEAHNVIDGEEHVFLDNKFPYRDPDGRIRGLMGISHDITDREARERELERYRSLVDAMPDPACIYDAEGRFELVNDALADLYDATPAELRGQRSHLVEQAREGSADDPFAALVAGEREEVTGEYEVDTAGRGRVVVEYRLSRLVIDGEFEGVVAVSRDVTEREERERRLRERERELAEHKEFTDEILDAIDDVFYLLGDDGTLRRWNETLPAVVGYDDDELAGKHATEFVPESEHDTIATAIETVLETGHTVFEAPVVTKAGDRIRFEFVAALVEDPGGAQCIAGVGRDITDRIERERELERTRDMLEQSQRLAHVGAWELDVEGGRPSGLRLTDEVKRVFNVPVDESVDLDRAVEFFHPDDRPTVQHAVERAVREGRPYEFEARVVTAAGRERWVRAFGDPVVAAGEVVRVRGSIQDVTEAKEYERQLHRRHRDLREYREFTDDVLDAVDDLFYVVDRDGSFRRWNETLPAVTGYTDAEIAEMTTSDFFADADVPAVADAIEEVFETGHARVEVPLRTSDGESIPYEFVATRVEDPDGETVLAGIGRDVSERKARERELERTKDLLQQAGRIAGVGGWELDVRADPPEMTWTDQLYDLHDLDPGTPVDVETAVGFYHPDDRDRIRKLFDRAVETGESYDMEVRLQTAAEDDRWVRAIGEPVVADGEVVSIRGSIQDITDRKERELALESLHETARGLLGVEEVPAAASLVAGAAEDVLDVGSAAVYLLRPDSNRFEPVATTPGFDEQCDPDPVVAGDESLLWDSFVTGTPTVVDETAGGGRSRPFGAGVGGGLVVPLGDHGVFVVATAGATVDDETRRLVETLVATAEAAFDRIETETALRERDAELAARNRRLQRQIAITEVIRRVDRSLVGASSREEIEAAVCDRLAGTDDVAFAWVGGLDGAGESLDPRAWAGAGEGYLDAVSFDVPDGADDATEPAVRAAATREPTVVGNVVDHLQAADWARSALACDLHSVVAVPLVYEEYFYGVLAVYAPEPDAFGDLERTVFAELGESIAHSINAVETRRALHADTLVELRLRTSDPDDLFGGLARETGGRVAFEGLASHSDDESRLFLSVAGVDPAAVESALDDRVSVREFRLVSRDGGTATDEDGGGGGGGAGTDGNDGDEAAASALFEVVVEGETLPARVVRHGGSPRDLVATGEALEAVVDVPTATDVREFVEMLGTAFPGIELVGRRTAERAAHTRGELRESLLDALTDRQLEVLRTAYFAGFFDWPRTSTGEDVAAMLGVTQPTVNRHLRLGQARLFAELFDGEPVDAAAVDAG